MYMPSNLADIYYPFMHACIHLLRWAGQPCSCPLWWPDILWQGREGTQVPADVWDSPGFRSSLITSQEQRAGLFSGLQLCSHSGGCIHWVHGTLAMCLNCLMVPAWAGAICSIGVPPLWTGAYVHSYSIPSYSLFSFTLLVIKSSAPNTIVQSVPKTGSPPWLAQCFSEATILPHTRLFVCTKSVSKSLAVDVSHTKLGSNFPAGLLLLHFLPSNT